MDPNNGVIEVSLQGNKVSLDHPKFNFQGLQTVTWKPVTSNTSVNGIALRIAEPPLPPFRQELSNPGEFTVRVPGAAAQNKGWQYVIQVNDRWFAAVLQSAAPAQVKPDEPEEPPELVNGTPTV